MISRMYIITASLFNFKNLIKYKPFSMFGNTELFLCRAVFCLCIFLVENIKVHYNMINKDSKMRKNNKKINTAELNKQNYIQEQYIVKDENAYNVISAKHRIIITTLLAALLISLSALLYWSAFMMPEKITVDLKSTDGIPQSTLHPEESAAGLSAFIEKYGDIPTALPMLEKYTEYQNTYPDIVGWISIDTIKVDYPVVQSPDPADPFKYLTLGPDENPSVKGAIFLDIRNSKSIVDKHTILYGHNMKDGTMFGQLDKYLNRDFFFNHLIIRYDTLYQELEWEVFNVFITTTDFYYIQTYFPTNQDFVNLMNQCVYQSYYNDNATVITEDDRVLTLSTCTNDIDDGRLVIQAKLITPLDIKDDFSAETSVETEMSSDNTTLYK